MFFTSLGREVYLNDMYKGGAAFLFLSGPSATKVNLSLLKNSGVLTMGVNNSPKILRPNLWTCVDPPDKFLASIFLDPTIIKLLPSSFSGKMMWDSVRNTLIAGKVVGDCPSTYYYLRNNTLDPYSFLTESTINWGNGDDNFLRVNGQDVSGKRSVMLAAIKILAALGVRTIFLVGADFKMEESKPYSFNEKKSQGACDSNNELYRVLNAYFTLLRPILEANNFYVYNTYEESGLTAFDFIPFEEAISFCNDTLPDITKENTLGSYAKLPEKMQKSRMLSGRYVPDRKNVVSLKTPVLQQKPVSQLYLSFETMWLKRIDIVKIYPNLEEVKKGVELLLSSKEGCKGCVFRKLVRPFVVRFIKEIGLENKKELCNIFGEGKIISLDGKSFEIGITNGNK